MLAGGSEAGNSRLECPHGCKGQGQGWVGAHCIRALLLQSGPLRPKMRSCWWVHIWEGASPEQHAGSQTKHFRHTDAKMAPLRTSAKHKAFGDDSSALDMHSD
eukprot:1146305-Pelagomonas_calceolata.AAC.10